MIIAHNSIAYISPQHLQKIKKEALKEANRITRHAALPNAEALGLFKLIMAASDIGILLKLVSTDVNMSTGCLTAELVISMGELVQQKRLLKELGPVLLNVIRANKRWQPHQSALKLKSTNHYNFLKASTLSNPANKSGSPLAQSVIRGPKTAYFKAILKQIVSNTKIGSERNKQLFVLADIVRPSSKVFANDVLSAADFPIGIHVMARLIMYKIGLSKLTGNRLTDIQFKTLFLIIYALPIHVRILAPHKLSRISESLLNEFAAGTGPDMYNFNADSEETKELLEHPYFQELTDYFYNLLLEKYNGQLPASGAQYIEEEGENFPSFHKAHNLHVVLYGLYDTKIGDLVGSFTDYVAVNVVGDEAIFTAGNRMGAKSFFYGNLLSDLGLSKYQVQDIQSGPFATKIHNFTWKKKIPDKYFLSK